MKFLLVFILLLICSVQAFEKNNDPAYEVSNFHIVYETPNENQIPAADLKKIPIELSMGVDGYIAPGASDTEIIYLSEFSPDDETSTAVEPAQGLGKNGRSRERVSYPVFHRSALQAICERLLRYLNKKGLSGVTVQIAPEEITCEGSDRRSRGRRYLTIKIRMAVVGEVGAFLLDEELGKCLPENNRQLSYIVSNSPMLPSNVEERVGDDLFSKDRLDSYLSFLNRHPNRRVDARIYPLIEENRVGIDYLVSENKPWRVFFDVGNTGNHVTGLWQETIGVLHTQLTGVDDVLRFDWTTDSFHSFYTFVGAYDRPILAWPKARWKVYGMFNRFAASDLGFEDKIFVGTQGVAELSFRENAAQVGSFFFDFLEGIRYYNIHVKNKFSLLFGNGQTQFAAPTFGFQMEQVQPLWRFFFKFEGQTSPNEFLAANRDDIDSLGRLNTSKGWTILNANFLTGLYVNKERPVHEFAFLAQGQYAFNYRLIPQLKFVVGGFNTVRGYPEAINSGDSAFTGRGEYLFHLAPFFAPDPKAKTTLFSKGFRPVPEYAGGRADWDFIIRGFFDVARSINSSSIIGLEENSTLISTGLGVEIDLWQNFMVRCDWGITLQRSINTDAGHSIVYLNSTVAY